jgi:hypothetical protein
MNELIKHLLNTYSIQCLVEMTGIDSLNWTMGKTNVLHGIDSAQYKRIKQGYINYLSDRLKEVKDIDTNEV